MTTKQITLIQIAKRQLGLDDDVYRTVLETYGDVRSARDLDTIGFESVMAYFKRSGFKSTASERNYGNLRPGMATARQVAYIRRLWSDWSDGAPDDDAAMNHWLEKHYGVSALRFVDAEVAQKAITGLKRMVARKS